MAASKCKQENLNFAYETKEALGNAVFWSLQLFLSDVINDTCFSNGTGYINGYLNEDLGPYKKGNFVKLSYNGDNVNIGEWDQEKEEYVYLYNFRVILQKPQLLITTN
jgi:hypothetical protein